MQNTFRTAYPIERDFRMSAGKVRSLFYVFMLSGSLLFLTSKPVLGQSGSTELTQYDSDLPLKITLDRDCFDSTMTDVAIGPTFIQISYALYKSASEPSEPERLALAARQQIKTIELKIRQQLKRSRRNDVTETTHQIRCVVDGTSRKCERVSELQTEVTSFGNLDLEGHVTLVDTRKQGAASSVVIALAPGHEQFPRKSVLDPRALGLLPSPAFAVARKQMDYLISHSDRHTTTINKVNFRGEECECVTFELESGVTIKSWICPRMKHAVLRVEGSVTRNELSIVDSVDTKMGFHEKSGTWFPTQVNYANTQDGQLVVSETLDIKVVSINEEIPRSEFRLSSFPRLHDGTKIRKVAANGDTEIAYWRNGRMSDWEELD